MELLETNKDRSEACGKIIEDILNKYPNSLISGIGEYLASDDVHRTLQQNFMRVVIMFISEQSKKSSHQYDDRNKQTVEICKEIAKHYDLSNTKLPMI